MPTPHEQLILDWERARLGAQEYLEAMPGEGYALRPSPDSFSFAEQFLHLGHTTYRFMAGIGAESPLKDDPAEKNDTLKSKPATLAYTLASYDFAIAAVKALSAESLAEEITFFRWTMSRALILAKALEHQVHHRGQVCVYFRLHGIKPPNEKLF